MLSIIKNEGGEMKKYVKLMADYSSSGIWGEDGIMMDMESLPISDELKSEITAWNSWYSAENDDYLEPEARRIPLFPIKLFSEKGLVLAKKIKKELPEWQVVFIDEEKLMEACNDSDIVNSSRYAVKLK